MTLRQENELVYKRQEKKKEKKQGGDFIRVEFKDAGTLY